MADGAAVRQYVEGRSIDEHLELDTYLDTEGVPQSGIQERYYYHQDTLRSVHALTDSSGAVVESYVYDPYGRHAVRSGSAGPLVVAGASSVGNRYTYTGRAYDAATGYLYYRYRLYDPRLGRFISQDPIGFAGGVGLYEYVGGSPTWGRVSGVSEFRGQVIFPNWEAQEAMEMINLSPCPRRVPVGYGEGYESAAPYHAWWAANKEEYCRKEAACKVDLSW